MKGFDVLTLQQNKRQLDIKGFQCTSVSCLFNGSSHPCTSIQVSPSKSYLLLFIYWNWLFVRSLQIWVISINYHVAHIGKNGYLR